MVRMLKIVALAASLASPAAAGWSQPTDSLRTPGTSMGSSGGVASGWQYTGRRRRTVQASGVAMAGLLLAAAAAASTRR